MWPNDFFPNSYWTDEYWPEGPTAPSRLGSSQPAGKRKRNRVLERMYAEAEWKHRQRAVNEKIRREVLMANRNRQDSPKVTMQRRAAMAMILAES